MPSQCDNTLFHSYYERMNEMNTGLQVAVYYYCYHTAILAAIIGFVSVNLLII